MGVKKQHTRRPSGHWSAGLWYVHCRCSVSYVGSSPCEKENEANMYICARAMIRFLDGLKGKTRNSASSENHEEIHGCCHWRRRPSARIKRCLAHGSGVSSTHLLITVSLRNELRIDTYIVLLRVRAKKCECTRVRSPSRAVHGARR